MGLYLIASFAMINPRYQKNYAYIALGVTIIALYVIATYLKNHGNFITLVVAVFALAAIGRILFQQKVARYF